MWNLKNIRNEQTKLKQTHRHREQTDGCQRAGGFGDWVKKGEGSEKHKLNRGDKVQHRNIVSHTVRTKYSARWVLEIPGKHCVKYMII